MNNCNGEVGLVYVYTGSGEEIVLCVFMEGVYVCRHKNCHSSSMSISEFISGGHNRGKSFRRN